MERVDRLANEVQLLRADLEQMTLAIEGLAASTTRRTRWLMGAVACTGLMVVALAAAAVIVERHTAAEIATANQKLCPMVALLIPDSAVKPRPATPYARELVRQAQALYAAYGCGPGKG